MQTLQIALAAAGRKADSRRERRFKTLGERFKVLPLFVRGISGARYAVLRTRAEKLFSRPDTASFKKLSKILTAMAHLKKLATRMNKILARQHIVATAPTRAAWVISHDLPAKEFRAEVVRHAMHSAVLAWMQPRTEVTALSHSTTGMKLFLDGVLRGVNKKRQERKLKPLKHRDEVIVASQTGSRWRQIAQQAARDAVDLCETGLLGYHPQGALDLMAYKQAFGLTCRNANIAGLGPRHFVAAQVLLSLCGCSQKHLAA